MKVVLDVKNAHSLLRCELMVIRVTKTVGLPRFAIQEMIRKA